MDSSTADHRFDLQTRDGYVLVRCVGKLQTVREAEEMQRSVEASLESAGHGRVVFDNRRTDEPSEAARASMWAWCKSSTRIERVALVLESELTKVRANMTAVGDGSSVRGFASEQDAAVWLLRRPTPRQRAQ